MRARRSTRRGLVEIELRDHRRLDPAVIGQLRADRPRRALVADEQAALDGRDVQRERAGRRPRQHQRGEQRQPQDERFGAAQKAASDDQFARRATRSARRASPGGTASAPRRASSCAAASRHGRKARRASRRSAAAAGRRCSATSAAAVAGRAASPPGTCPAIAITSAASSIRRNSASRRRLAAGPRASVICCGVCRRRIPNPTKAASRQLTPAHGQDGYASRPSLASHRS